jgi:hypothetical protein
MSKLLSEDNSFLNSSTRAVAASHTTGSPSSHTTGDVTGSVIEVLMAGWLKMVELLQDDDEDVREIANLVCNNESYGKTSVGVSTEVLKKLYISPYNL